MKFASRPAFITVKKSVMKLNQDGEPMPTDAESRRKQPAQLDAPTRVRPFSVGKLRALVEQANEQQKTKEEPARAGSITTNPVVLPPASTSLLRTPVKASVVAAAALLVFAGVGLAIFLVPKQAHIAAPAEPPAAVVAATPVPEPAPPAPAAPASAAGFVFTDPVVLLPGTTAEGTGAPAPQKTAEKSPERTPEKRRPAADKPASPPAVAKAPEAKPDPKAPAATGNEMDEMRRIQQMANSQLDKSIH